MYFIIIYNREGEREGNKAKVMGGRVRKEKY